jgi:serine phosphatase RsbU (regulator of sigma subunit)
LAYLLFYAFSTLDIIAGNSDIVAYSATVSYSVIGIFCEVFIFAYANLQKNRNYQLALIRGKEEAQEQAVKQLIENQRIVSEQNVMLEARVRERTEELLSANEELMQSQEEITMQRDSLTWKNLELEKKQSLIDDSINAALIIQNAILPSKVKMELAFSNYYLLFKPKNTVSGDFYWLGELDNITIIAVADCTGHGVQGALMSMIGNTLLDKIVLLQQITDPAEILNRLHSEINNRLRQHESNSREGMDIAVFAWETDGFNVDVSFEGAKRPLYYVLKGENQVHEVKSARKGVGGSQNEEKFFETKKLHLPLKTFFLLQSDGLIDQQDSKNEKIGSKGMKEFIAENAPKGFAEFGRNLDKKLENQLRDSVQRDDILVLAFEI